MATCRLLLENKIYGDTLFFMKIIMVKGHFFAIKKCIVKDNPFTMKYNFLVKYILLKQKKYSYASHMFHL